MNDAKRPDPALALLSPSERARAALIGPRDVALLVFEVNGARHAVELHRTREILRSRKATPLPRVPDFIEGVIAIRGEIMPVVDVALRLYATLSAAAPRARLLVVAGQKGEPAALRVEAVLGVVRFRPELVREPPPDSSFLRAVTEGTELTRVLDLDALLDFRAVPLG